MPVFEYSGFGFMPNPGVYSAYLCRLELAELGTHEAYTWEGFNHALEAIGWPKPRIRIDLDPCRRAEAY